MADPAELEELIVYLVRGSRLSRAEITRLVGDVVAFLNESAEEFICRRHRELQDKGYANSEIFSRIGSEAARRPFRAPLFTERQIRRIIYG